MWHYIDNEVPAYGEWDSVVQQGASTIKTCPEASFPERGAAGLRVEIAGTDVAYVQKDLEVGAPPAGGYLLGFWMRIAGYPSDSTEIGILYSSKTAICRIFLLADGRIVPRLDTDSGGNEYCWSSPGTILPGRWQYVAGRFVRASSPGATDGGADLYVDGVLRATNRSTNNYNSCCDTQLWRFGVPVLARDGFVIDLDEWKFSSTYPEPYAAMPPEDAAHGARTCVLIPDTADGREFADHAIQMLGVPRAHVVTLPNASGTETLASYAAFQSEVEDDLSAWMDLHARAADRIRCFLVGPGVPGAFLHGGQAYSTTSRLARFGSAFSPNTANPLYAPQTPARLTAADLAQAGVYLVTRCDGPNVAAAKALLDRAAAVAALDALGDGDTLYSDEAAYRASLDCQQLRCQTAPLGVYVNDVLVWGDTGTPSFGAAGTRAVFADDSGASASTVRADISPCGIALITAGYAAALGSAGPAATFDARAFFEMLRIGGTFAEAALTAMAHLDSTAVAVGSPLLTVPFARAGYNVYVGDGGPEAVNWQDPVACARADVQTATLSAALQPGRPKVVALRRISAAGVEEHNTHVVAYADVDEQGTLLAAPLAAPRELTAEWIPGAGLRLSFTWVVPPGFAAPQQLAIYSDGGTGTLDLETPVATASASPGQREAQVDLDEPDPDSLPIRLAVRASTPDRCSALSETVTVPRPAQPTSPVLL